MEEVVIVGAKRTPIGKINKSLASYSAVELGTITAQAVLKQANIDPEDVDQVIFGNAIQAGNGQNIARQIEINAGISPQSTAFTVNQVCGSGLKAIQSAMNELLLGNADVILAGGTESMSNVPYLNKQQRKGNRFGSITLEDALETDGLMDAFSLLPMGITGENVADQFNVSREDQDRFALASHQKALAAYQRGAFDDEIVPVLLPNGDLMAVDESIRPDTSLAKLAQLKPAFLPDGTVTAGNSPTLNDGASALILTTANYAKQHHLPVLAHLNGYAERGIDPSIMGYAPYYAVNRLLDRQNHTVADVDLFEVNEAFASQSVAVTRDLDIPADKININGGAIALGHPLGDSGARIVTTLLYNLRHNNKHTGIATLCMGGGIGAALSITVD